MMPWFILCALVMILLCAACRNTSVSRTTGTAPEAMMSARTCPGPTEGNWSMSPTMRRALLSGTAFSSACISMTSTIEVSSTTSRSHRVVHIAFEAAALRVCLEQPMNRLGLKAGGLGHALGCAAGRGAKEQVDALRSENAQDRIDEGRLADSWAAGNDEHLRQQSQADCLGLTAGEREASLGLDPGECLMRVDVGPRQSAICQTRQTLGGDLLCAIEAA